MVRCGVPPQTQKQSPWSSAIEKGIDSLADWLIPTLGHPDEFTFSFHTHSDTKWLRLERILVLSSQRFDFHMNDHLSIAVNAY